MDADGAAILLKLQIRRRFEEQLGDDEVCPSVDFFLQVSEVLLVGRAVRVASRVP